MQAIGMIETKGYCAIVEAADVMMKTADVKLVALERIGSSLLTVTVTGDVGAVEEAVAAGVKRAEELGDIISYKVIPRPHETVGVVLQTMAKYFDPCDED
ncbi:MAG: BMC domain-containing protein [Eubacteriales bacterium]|nr:BMC domain-containing protein [Eubacteriales bacterium]